MLIMPLVVGSLLTNCYLVACEKRLEALIIDPGFIGVEAERVFEEIRKRNLRIKYVVNTHGHMDHISGNLEIKERMGVPILVHREDAGMLTDPLRNLSGALGLTVVSPPPDMMLQDGDKIHVGFLEFEVIHTPGHTPGSISLYCRSERVVFTGDTLFAGSVGRTDLPSASHEKLMLSIRERLFSLPDDTVVYPGHGEETTIGKEKRWNPFVAYST